MKVLVTGGSGFLGSNVIKTISAAHPDWTVYNLDRRESAASATQAAKTFLQADITSLDSVTSALQRVKPDVVVHTAGVVPNGQSRYSNAASVRDYVQAINVGGTRNMLSASRDAGVTSFVHTSSCTVISDDLAHDYPLMNEAMPTGHATLAYGASKAAAEALVLAANDDDEDSPTGMRTCALRPATVIGPGDSYGVIDTIYTLVANWETPFVIGDGHNMYDFVFIDNVAYAHLLAVENLVDRAGGGGAAGQAFFVSNQEPVYFRDFMLAVWAQCGGHVPPFELHVPAGLAWFLGLVAEGVSWVTGREAALSRGSVGDALGTRYSDNSKAVEVLGYRPKVRFSEGVRIACEDFKRRQRAREAQVKKGGVEVPN